MYLTDEELGSLEVVWVGFGVSWLGGLLGGGCWGVDGVPVSEGPDSVVENEPLRSMSEVSKVMLTELGCVILDGRVSIFEYWVWCWRIAGRDVWWWKVNEFKRPMERRVFFV